MLAVHNNDGKFSVCTPQGIIASGVERYQAAEAIAAVVDGISEAEIFQALDTPTDPAVFRTVWSEAVTNSVLELEADVESLPNAETVNHVLDRQAKLFAAVAELQRELLRNAIAQKIKEYETAIETLALKTIAALAERGLKADARAWEAARQSDLGIQLAELQKQLEEV